MYEAASNLQGTDHFWDPAFYPGCLVGRWATDSWVVLRSMWRNGISHSLTANLQLRQSKQQFFFLFSHSGVLFCDPSVLI